MSNPHKNRSRPRVGRIIFLGLLALLVLACILFRWSGNRRVEQALEAIRAEGYPVEPEELDAWYPEPDGKNAAEVLDEAFACHVYIQQLLVERLPVSGKADTPTRTEPLSEPTKKVIAHHLEQNADALALIHEAAAIPESRWPVDCLHGYGIDLSHLHQVRTCAELLMLEAMYKAEHGDSEGAAKAVLSTIGVVNSIAQEPVLRTQEVRAALLGASGTALEQTLNRTALKDAQLARIKQALREAEDTDGFVRGLVGERCMAADVIRHSADQMPMEKPFMLMREVIGLNAVDTAVVLESFEAMIAAAKTPLDDRLEAARSISGFHDALPGYCALSRLVVPDISFAIKANIRAGTQLRVARVGLAVERYRLTHGELPESLDDLVPEFIDAVPKDPFGDGPVKYKLLENGFMVYSIGVDEEDDGGKEQGWIEKNGKRRQEDIREVDLTFAVQRTP